MPAAPGVLIRSAELQCGRRADVRILGDTIAAVGSLTPSPAEHVVDAGGALLLPGLQDHHIHIAATAAALASIECGPPAVANEAQLAAALARPGTGWLRGIGYHESVAGLIGRDWLDAVAPTRPLRVQHRSGRMWVFNSAGLEILLAADCAPPPELERIDGRLTGRLYDADQWLRQALGSAPPAFDAVGAELAGYGITGVTEISPANGPAAAVHFSGEHRRGALPQRITIAGTLALGDGPLDPALRLGPVKLHLHEAHLPEFEGAVAAIGAAHDAGRVVAVHCVTAVELAFTLAALDAAGIVPGDRIEHASVADDAAVGEIASRELVVVAQPNFVFERGDAYRALIPPDEWPQLYRLKTFERAGVTLAGGSDAPFGRPDPWAAMAAAVERRTRSGEPLGAAEALTPEAALGLFLADPGDLAQRRTIAPGAPADLCLLATPWRSLRANLAAARVRMTWIAGRIVHRGAQNPG